MHIHNYWNPLSGKVESPAPLQLHIPPKTLNHITNTRAKPFSFQLPINHINKDSTDWRRSPRSQSRYTLQQEENSNQKRTCRTKPLTEAKVKCGVLDGTIPSIISNTCTTSSAGLDGDPYIPICIKSTKIFHMTIVSTNPASDVCKLEHNLQDTSKTVGMFPGLVNVSLLSTSKLASAGCMKVYDRKEVNVYDGSTTKIIVSEEAVLKGWLCPQSTLWITPLTSQVKNLNTDTLLLDSPDGQQSLN